jgi:hypothetical protein
MEAQEFDQWAMWPAPEPPPVKPPTSDTVASRVRRYATAGVLAVGLVASGVAVVAAASPDPSASPTPQSTSSADGSGAAGTPSTDAQTGTHANCPKDQTSSTTDSTTTQ